jgi:hypothetical protein
MRVLIFILLMTVVTAAEAAYKCTGADGKVQYIETPCPAGTTGSEVLLQPNTLDTSGARAQTGPQPDRSAQADAPAAAVNVVCPTSLDVRNLETSAAGVTIGKMEQAFLRDEVRRARACPTGGNRYTADDWRRIRDGQSAQLGSDPQRRKAERRTVEDIHASASPAERERIQSERAALAARGPNAIVDCDGMGCWDTAGVRYNRVTGGNQFMREDGRQCRSIANRMECD